MRYIRDLIPISWLFVAVLGMIYFLQPAILDQIPLFARVTVYASAVLMVISQEMRHYRLKRANEDKLGPRWASGIFLGYVRDSYEYAVWDTETSLVELARSLKRVPPEDRLDVDAIEAVDRRPQDLLHRAAWGAMPRQE